MNEHQTVRLIAWVVGSLLLAIFLLDVVAMSPGMPPAEAAVSSARAG
jgi:hypothetical protein